MEKKTLFGRIFAVKGMGVVLIAAICGGILLLLSAIPFEKSAEQASEELVQYRAEVQAELAALLGRVEGTGTVEVMVLLEEGGEKPRVSGIGIVCGGGGDANVQAELIGLCCALFDLPSHNVFVTKGR